MSTSPQTEALPLEARELAIGYNAKGQAEKTLASGLNLRMERGELCCLMGCNGAGKTTLIRTLSGLQAPLRGEITWMGADFRQLTPRQRARQLAVVLTGFGQAGAMRVRELVGLGRYPHTGWQGTFSEADHAAVAQALEQTGCDTLAERQVATLSDGERQRALIARALAQQTRIIVLDEPTAFLDVPGRAQTMLLLRRLAHEQGLAVLLSTHDLSLALESADRLWLLDDAGVLHEGAPEDLVLSGALQQAFSRGDYALDPGTGALRLNETPHHRIHAPADGSPEHCWLLHALHRHGYALDEDAPLSIRRVETGWQIGEGTQTAETFTTLGQAMRHLRTRSA